MPDRRHGLTPGQRAVKRSFDIVVSVLGLIVLSGVILVTFIIASIDTRSNGFFVQRRIGRWGKPFRVIKIRTMRVVSDIDTTVTTANDARITKVGAVLRRLKLDELPQLINVLMGTMSFVGPRPDVPGFADTLKGEDRLVLSIRPGITGPATLHFRNEEELLASQEDPECYNHEVIYPAKVRMNRQYIDNYSMREDLRLIWRTVVK